MPKSEKNAGIGGVHVLIPRCVSQTATIFTEGLLGAQHCVGSETTAVGSTLATKPSLSFGGQWAPAQHWD